MIRAIYWLTLIVFGTSHLIYSKALGIYYQSISFVSVLLGLIFVIMGNYMPKLCKVNHTVGIRLPWTFTGVKITGTKPIAWQGSCGSRRFDPPLEAGLHLALLYVLSVVIPRHCVYPYGVISISIKSEKSLYKNNQRRSSWTVPFRLFFDFG